MQKNNWFEIDKKGLQQVQSEKDKFFIIKELVSNSFDENISNCNLNIGKTTQHKSYINCIDNSKDGFRDLKDSYTMFAPSYKKGIVEKRGRFNVGEKFALAMFKYAFIKSTTGSVKFLDDGSRKRSSIRTIEGTEFYGELNLTWSEISELSEKAKTIIPPMFVNYSVNGHRVRRPDDFKIFTENLPTVVTDDEGNLVRSSRLTNIELFKTDKHFIYEMGIPVVETDIGFSINVDQKIPLNKDRDNVSPSYLKKLKTYVLNHTSSDLTDEQAKSAWVTEALENADVDAVKDVVESRYGEDAVVFDMSDHEANKKAFADDVNVITGGSFNSRVWDNIKRTREEYKDFARPSGSIGKYASPNFDGEIPAKVLDKSKVTKEMKQVVSLYKRLHKKLFGVELNVTIYNEFGLGGNRLMATYCGGTNGSDLEFYYKTLGKKWFDLKTNKVEIIDLMIHEFGHWYSGDHLSEKYYDGLTRIGAKLYCGVNNG
tara:strand:- start:4489 stop:5943 length:1455 start_codon:yes stop_codon:yes gene_type:complete